MFNCHIRSIIVLVLCIYGHACYGQFTSFGPTSISDGDIYALIIGISDYEDPAIEDLKFSNRDAEVFADYLMSDAGGNIPESNIKLLTDKQATIANIYAQKAWLESKAQEDDLVFFYFSGHGDVESSLYELGFLLAHDTPNKNYLNNAIRIEDINNMANTLSVVKGAKVILITDACKSGKLAGENRGRDLAARDLTKVKQSEVRIASCESYELSQENERWGGGRGVFSFYLINGLKGLADSNEDQSVSLRELDAYLAEKVTDEVEEFLEEDQNPVVEGRRSTLLAIVDEDVLANLNEESETGSLGAGGTRSVDALLKDKVLYDFFQITEFFSEAESSSWIDKPLEGIQEQIVLVAESRFMNDVVHYVDSVNSESIEMFKLNVAAGIHNYVQESINDYLVGDAEELKRRQYYNAKPEEFVHLAVLLEKAMTLTDTSVYLYDIMHAKSQYFRGIAKRIEMDADISLDHNSEQWKAAFAHQTNALNLQSKAAYVHNEQGILYAKSGDNNKAIESFQTAHSLAPKWALPVANLAFRYNKSKQYSKAEETIEKALKLQPDYHMAYNTRGVIGETKGDLLMAEESYLRSIDLNDLHFFPYERLGHLYTKLCDYERADRYFQWSFDRMNGIDFAQAPGDPMLDFPGMTLEEQVDLACQLNPSKFGSNDYMANAAFGHFQLMERNYMDAEKHLMKALLINPSDPALRRWLAEVAFLQNDFIKAEHYFTTAAEYYLDSISFNSYINENLNTQKYLDCAVALKYENLHYDREELNYFLGEIYTKQGRFEEAKYQYLEIILDQKEAGLPLRKIWELEEKQGLYEETEKYIWEYIKIDPQQGHNELIAFYERRARESNKPSDWNYKAGLALYELSFGVFYSYNESEFLRFLQIYDTPGTKVEHTGAPAIISPSQTSYTYFDKAKVHLEKEKKADALDKMGNIAIELGDFELAKEHWTTALEMFEDKGSTRQKLAYNLIDYNYYTEALNQMNILSENGHLNYPLFSRMIKFKILRGESSAEIYSDIQRAKEINPLDEKALEQALALNHVLNDDVVKAERILKDLIKGEENVFQNLYTLARLKINNGKEKDGLKYLKKAIDEGFRYSWVVDRDKSWNNVRDKNKFQELRNRLPASQE